MEQLFSRHFWILNFLFIVGVAFLCARTLNTFIEGALLPLPTVRTQVLSATPKLQPPPQLNDILVAKLTGLPTPKPEPEVKEPAKPQVDLSGEPVHTSLKLRLLGTLLSEGTPKWSIASIQSATTAEVRTYAVGDFVAEAEILEIQRDRVIILNNYRREFIDAKPGDGKHPPIAVLPSPIAKAVPKKRHNKRPPAQQLGAGVKQVSENTYDIPRTEIDKTLSNLNNVAMQARIVPAFKDGVAQGFKLFSIRPNSIYSKIGIQNGDVIKRINGYDMNSPEKALEIYSKLKESSRIDIEVERNGAKVHKVYNVR